MAAHTSSKPPADRPAERGSRSGSRVGAIALAGIAVLVIAASAILLSYNGIYQIALQGNIDPPLAHVFPGVFTLLLLVAFWTTYLLRDAPRAQRIWVDLLILLLILLAAAASALRSLDYRLLEPVAVVVVAGAPWLALLIAFRLWLWIIAHLRGEIPARARVEDPVAEDPGHPVSWEEEPTRSMAHPGRSVRVAPPHEHTGPAGSDPRDNDDTVPLPVVEEGPERDTAPSVDGDRTRPAPGGARGTDDLPRRRPGGDNPIKRAADPVPAPVPAPARDAGTAPPVDGVDDGFVPDPPIDDPAGDESYSEGSDAPAPAHPPTPELRKRAMVLKPRRTVPEGVPPEPPSGRVRSEPTPPGG
ncbi:hypothetical protein ACQEU5_10495 [Marinactinospora thermotolerans]|uniref:DUF2637 domain-containing protein n=1 Tax=Marinactinospora thermotolerans DSM 45154 TaxID=1122192 RepID=A0A1T4MYZ0_9ACTN|nr:hypothetical protein [Marinactinospora thermotolerans]SJZ72121.1 hypothetical protein SAMN02745673_01199 [Marinactinospora thermotolerans DSM 45154]